MCFQQFPTEENKKFELQHICTQTKGGTDSSLQTFSMDWHLVEGSAGYVCSNNTGAQHWLSIAVAFLFLCMVLVLCQQVLS